MAERAPEWEGPGWEGPRGALSAPELAALPPRVSGSSRRPGGKVASGEPAPRPATGRPVARAGSPRAGRAGPPIEARSSRPRRSPARRGEGWPSWEAGGRGRSVVRVAPRSRPEWAAPWRPRVRPEWAAPWRPRVRPASPRPSRVRSGSALPGPRVPGCPCERPLAPPAGAAAPDHTSPPDPRSNTRRSAARAGGGRERGVSWWPREGCADRLRVAQKGGARGPQPRPRRRLVEEPRGDMLPGRRRLFTRWSHSWRDEQGRFRYRTIVLL